MRSLLVSLVGVAVLVGCSPGQGESPSPSVGVTSRAASAGPTQSVGPSPTPSPTAVASFPDSLPTDDPEKAAVIAGWQEYWRVYEKYAADPTGFADYTETQYVAIGEEANLILDRLELLRSQKLRNEGGMVFRDVEVVLDSARATAIVTYCSDLASLRVRDVISGEYVVRTGTMAETASLERGADGKWRVFQIRNDVREC